MVVGDAGLILYLNTKFSDPFYAFLKDAENWGGRKNCLMLSQIKRTVYWGVVICMCICFKSTSVSGSELYLLGGVTKSSDESTSRWQLSYWEDLGDHFAYSVSWVNEGHLTGHHRDGPACQFWGRTNLLNGRLSLAAGVGPYLFFDTLQNGGPEYKDIQHGWAGVGSLAATWHTESGWLFQLLGNYLLADNNINTGSVMLGIGYDLDKLGRPDSIHSVKTQPEKDANNEITVFLGGATVNSSKNSETSIATGIEYRRGIFPYLDWTIGWLYEGDMDLLRRSGLTTQFWPTKSFLDHRISLSIGLGMYIALDTRYLHGTDEDETILGLITPTISYRFEEPWLVRLSWNRTVSRYNRDTDVILIGIGYQF